MRKRIVYIFLMLLLLIPLTSCFSLPSGDKKNDKSDVAPTLEIKTDDLLKEVGDTITWYELDLYIGDTYNLDIKLKDYDGDDYSIVYIFNYEDNYTDSVYLDGNILKTKDNAKDKDRANLKVEVVKKNTNKALEIKNIFIELHERKASIELTSLTSDVSVTKVNSNDYSYMIYVPMAGKYYQMPDVKYINYDDEYTITYTTDEELDNVELKYDEDTLYFIVDPENNIYSHKEIYINIFDKNNKLLNTYTTRIGFTYEDEDIFQLYYGNNKELLKDGDSIYIEKTTINEPLLAYYNNGKINSMSKVLTIEVANTEVVKDDRASTDFGYEHVLKPNGIGQTTIKFIYNKGGDREREINISVYIYDGKNLSRLYVPSGKDAFSIVDNNLYINGKIYAIFEVGKPEAINGNDNLDVIVTDASNPNQKTVTLIYEYKGITKSLSYDIDIVKTNKFEKTNIETNYYDYWSNNGYSISPSLGEAKVLAIPIWFTDSNTFISETTKDSNGKTQKEQIIDDLNTVLFGDNDDLNYRSLRTYYLEESFGNYKISGTVTPWYSVNAKSTDYQDKSDTITTLVSDAIKWYFDESGTTDIRSDYDINDDGKIDYVFAYYGANYHVIKDDTPYSRAWCRKVANAKESSLQVFGWISAMNMYSLAGVKVKDSQLSISDLSLTRGLDTKTTIHEYAHGMGVYDMYDTNMSYVPTDSFNMQSSNRGGHDPFSMMALGYAKPYVFDSKDSSLDNEIIITINDFQSSGDLILLTPKWDNNKQIFDEYLLLELYTPTGLNAYDASSNSNFRGVGIRLWHVNALVNPSTNRHYYTNSSDTTNDLVHFIRDDKNHTLRENTILTEPYLFTDEESFNMNDYKSQFYNNNGKLDNGLDLGWSFVVLNVETDDYGNATATIKLTKTL